MTNIRMTDTDDAYNTIRSAFYDMMTLTMFRNTIINMGEPGQKFMEDFLATCKAEMVRHVERDAKAIADRFDFDAEGHVAQLTAMVDEIVIEFRDILRKR